MKFSTGTGATGTGASRREGVGVETARVSQPARPRWTHARQGLGRGALAGIFRGVLLGPVSSGHSASVKFEAESGTRGADYAIGNDGGTQYIYPTSSSTATNPGSAARVVTFTVTFPEAGTYDLYARVRVGPGAANDDSFFYGNGFGSKSPTSDADWILCNNLTTPGFTGTSDIVTGGGTAGSQVWKWINLSEFNGGETPITFTVTSGSLTQTFQVGAREDGLYLDAFAFGTANYTFTVADLDAGTGGNPPPPPPSGLCTVNWNDVHQRIDGFGASSAWRSAWTTAQADLLFSTNTGIVYTDNSGHRSTNNGIGLSLLRTRIAPGGTTIESSIMQMAQARGAKVWSAPWTPAAGFKSSGALDGGNYLGSGANATNLAYANQLANYVVNMKNTYGINLYAISIQNEPDVNHPDPGGYETCLWSFQQIHDFTTNLYNALLAHNVSSTLIMLPESGKWWDPQGLGTATVSDAVSLADVGIIANHDYATNNTVGDTTIPAVVNNYSKALWETEVALLSGSDSSMANGLYYGTRIHLFMTVAQVNAWHYWWLISGNGVGNQGLMDGNAATTKRLFTVGQYSRFVRPGYYRIDATNSGTALISAYKDPVAGNFAIVAVNTNGSSIGQTFNLTNVTGVTSVTPWITSASFDLASQMAVAVTNSAFTCTLPAQSVVTFVGQAVTNVPPNTAPTLAFVDDQTINAGVTLVVTNSVTDAEVPPQTLTFSLLSITPTNATLDATTGVFTWRPLVSQADTTNLIVVRVTDNGAPSLSDTNSYTITVNPLAQPTLDSVSASSGQVSLVVGGPFGPDYTLWTSTNLIDWQVLSATNSPVTPITLVVTNLIDRARFYRIQIGP